MILTESFPTAIRPKNEINAIGLYSYGSFNASNGSVNYRIETGGKIWTYSYQAFTSGNVNITYVSAS